MNKPTNGCRESYRKIFAVPANQNAEVVADQIAQAIFFVAYFAEKMMILTAAVEKAATAFSQKLFCRPTLPAEVLETSDGRARRVVPRACGQETESYGQEGSGDQKLFAEAPGKHEDESTNAERLSPINLSMPIERARRLWPSTKKRPKIVVVHILNPTNGCKESYRKKFAVPSIRNTKVVGDQSAFAINGASTQG